MNLTSHKGWGISLFRKGEFDYKFYVSKEEGINADHLVFGKVQGSMWSCEEGEYGYLATFQECIEMIDKYEDEQEKQNKTVTIDISYQAANQLVMFQRNLYPTSYKHVPDYMGLVRSLEDAFGDEGLGFRCKTGLSVSSGAIDIERE